MKWKESAETLLSLGHTEHGEAPVREMARLRHLLVAGETATGKTAWLRALLRNLTAEQVQTVVITPVRAEFADFEERVQLFSTPEEALAAVRRLEEEVQRRSQVKPKTRSPTLIAVVDTFERFDTATQQTLIAQLTPLLPKAHSVGLYLLLSLRSEALRSLPGAFKAEFLTRLAFRVATAEDSERILDQPGAETLQKPGEFLFAESGKKLLPIRAPTPPPGEPLKNASEPHPESSPPESSPPQPLPLDDLYARAVEIIRQIGHPSVSVLQRNLRIGYNQASALIDRITEAGLLP